AGADTVREVFPDTLLQSMACSYVFLMSSTAALSTALSLSQSNFFEWHPSDADDIVVVVQSESIPGRLLGLDALDFGQGEGHWIAKEWLRQLSRDTLVKLRIAYPDVHTSQSDGKVSVRWVCEVDVKRSDANALPAPFAAPRPGLPSDIQQGLLECGPALLSGQFVAAALVLRADIVMDVGTSLNPAIDVGQVEGGFVQGMGWVTMEELVWGDKQHKWVRPGHLFTRGPGTYKIPTANDIPVDMRVALLKDAPNPRAVYSSKAVGEPPFHLAASVFFAMKDAIGAARQDAGHTEWFQLDSPATPERIRMACADSLTAPYAAPTLRPKQSA
ncbi:xylitol dehydrogenase, partial [Cymbomonas tetramitiformis]